MDKFGTCQLDNIVFSDTPSDDMRRNNWVVAHIHNGIVCLQLCNSSGIIIDRNAGEMSVPLGFPCFTCVTEQKFIQGGEQIPLPTIRYTLLNNSDAFEEFDCITKTYRSDTDGNIHLQQSANPPQAIHI